MEILYLNKTFMSLISLNLIYSFRLNLKNNEKYIFIENVLFCNYGKIILIIIICLNYFNFSFYYILRIDNQNKGKKN